jgi:CHAD domain-containing protein
MALLHSAGAAFPDPILPLSQVSQPTTQPTDQASRPVTIRLPLPPRPEPAAVGPTLAQALEERWEAYREQLRRCQRKSSRAAVHELRVATRRLLAQLVLLSCVTPSAELDKAHRILKRRLAALGDLRDTQVQLGFIDQQTARFPALAPLSAWLRGRERRLVKAAAGKVNRFKTRKLGRWVSAMIGDLTASAPRSRAQKHLTTAVLRATRNAFAEAVRRRQAIDLANLRTIHQTRIAFKRFRYMVESVSPGLTGLSRRQLRALAFYQRKMGIIQDLEVTRRCVKSFMREHRRTEALLRPFCGYLRQRRARALRSFLKSADDLLAFSPPARLAAPDNVATARNAA